MLYLTEFDFQIFQYNLFTNVYEENTQFCPISANGGDGASFDYRFNCLVNSGFGAIDNPGTHCDYTQQFGDAQNEVVIQDFNCVIENSAVHQISTQGFSWENSNSTPPPDYVSMSISNNTLVLKNTGNSYSFLINREWVQNTITVADNYIDPTGLGVSYPVWLKVADPPPGPYTPTVLVNNNANMITGSVAVNNSGEFSWNLT